MGETQNIRKPSQLEIKNMLDNLISGGEGVKVAPLAETIIAYALELYPLSQAPDNWDPENEGGRQAWMYTEFTGEVQVDEPVNKSAKKYCLRVGRYWVFKEREGVIGFRCDGRLPNGARAGHGPSLLEPEYHIGYDKKTLAPSEVFMVKSVVLWGCEYFALRSRRRVSIWPNGGVSSWRGFDIIV